MSKLTDLHSAEERLKSELADVREAIKELEGPELGKLPNSRAGFHHIHSDSYECGQAYRAVDPWDAGDWAWQPCTKLVNHTGECGYEDSTAF